MMIINNIIEKERAREEKEANPINCGKPLNWKKFDEESVALS